MVWSLTLSVVLFRFRGLNVVTVDVFVCLLGTASWHFANALKPEKDAHAPPALHKHTQTSVRINSEFSPKRYWQGPGSQITGDLGWGARWLYLTLHCHHQNDFCLKTGSDEGRLNLSLNVTEEQNHKCPQHKLSTYTYVCIFTCDSMDFSVTETDRQTDRQRQRGAMNQQTLNNRMNRCVTFKHLNGKMFTNHCKTLTLMGATQT